MGLKLVVQNVQWGIADRAISTAQQLKLRCIPVTNAMLLWMHLTKRIILQETNQHSERMWWLGNKLCLLVGKGRCDLHLLFPSHCLCLLYHLHLSLRLFHMAYYITSKNTTYNTLHSYKWAWVSKSLYNRTENMYSFNFCDMKDCGSKREKREQPMTNKII